LTKVHDFTRVSKLQPVGGGLILPLSIWQGKVLQFHPLFNKETRKSKSPLVPRKKNFLQLIAEIRELCQGEFMFAKIAPHQRLVGAYFPASDGLRGGR
jgi:hypothetical protein